MPTYYVNPGGTDGAGQSGLSNAPADAWLTISYAFKTRMANGDTLLIGDGTYAESTLGCTYMNFNDAKTDLTFSSENGVAANVIIQGASAAAHNTDILRALRYTFNNLTFMGRVGSSNSLIIEPSANDVVDLVFNNCLFISQDAVGAAVTIKCLTVGSDATRITFTNCSGSCVAYTAASYGLYVNNNAAGVTCDAITMTNCEWRGGLYGILWLGATNTVITGGYAGGMRTGGQSYGACIGADSDTGPAGTGSCTGMVCETYGTSGHALLIGAGMAAFVIDSCVVPKCFDYGIATKSNTGTIIRQSIAAGGTQCAIGNKAGQTALLQDNRAIAGAAGAYYTAQNTALTKVSGCEFVDNLCLVRQSSPMFNMGGAADDDGTNVVDRNRYKFPRRSLVNWGYVYGSAVTGKHLSNLQAAWAGYALPTNDANSQLLRPHRYRPW